MESLFYEKNILIVSESYTHGGLETHLEGELRQLKKYAMRVILITGVHDDAVHQIGADKVYTGIDFDFVSKPGNFGWISKKIQEIILKEKIDIVHSHPYLSIPTSYHACVKTNTPFLYTLHGPSSVHNTYGEYFTALMTHILKKVNPIVVSQELADIVVRAHPDTRPIVCPNSVQFSEDNLPRRHTRSQKPIKILIVSRIDEQKAVGVMKFIEILATLPKGSVLVDMAGDGPFSDKLRRWLDDKGIKFVGIMGAVRNVSEIMKDYDLIGGMGRVVIEAISSRVPVCLIGYDGVKGMLKTINQLKKASYANFSGRNLPNIGTSELQNQIDTLTSHRIEDHLYGFARENYNEDLMWRRLFATLKPAIVAGDQYYISLAEKHQGSGLI